MITADLAASASSRRAACLRFSQPREHPSRLGEIFNPLRHIIEVELDGSLDSEWSGFLGASKPSRLRKNSATNRFWEGRDFSRAAKSSKIGGALAPEVGSLLPKRVFQQPARASSSCSNLRAAFVASSKERVFAARLPFLPHPNHSRHLHRLWEPEFSCLLLRHFFECRG